MSKPIIIGKRTYEPPFSIDDAGFTTDIVDTKGDLLMGWHGRKTALHALVMAALNDYRPWRYQSKGELPVDGTQYEVTLESGDIAIYKWYDGVWWMPCAGEWIAGGPVRAFRERAEPAPKLAEADQ